MQQFWSSLVSLESVAVLTAIAYLLLAARENLWCWACAFVSSTLYTYIFWDVRLLMESALNVFYVVMAVVGWWEWRYGGKQHEGLRIHRLRGWQHAALIAAVLVLASVNGYMIQRYTHGAFPFLDSFTTWGAVVTTFLVVRKVLENWLYWLVVDSVSIYLYIDRGLYLTALLFAAYLIIVLFGWRRWLLEYRQQQAAADARDAPDQGVAA
ncbi:MAG TPA: nicotinamide riboside transporter PnuC [Hyphomicrobiales bacterium]|nr:nicotinamide riboside transporter PnuC [Hyphomicrobiales bacterium]